MTAIASAAGAPPGSGRIGNGGDRVFAFFGERPADVAQRAGVELADLLRANPQLDEHQTLLAGEEIRLPRPEVPDRPVLLAENNLYKHTDADGRVTYSDVPPSSPGLSEVLRPDGRRSTANQKSDDQKPQPSDAKDLIKAAQKHGGKLDDYMKELDYLRRHDPRKLDAVLKELQASDPKLWVELQKHPQFRPLVESLSFDKNSARYLEAGVEGVKTVVTKGVTSVPGAVAPKLGESTVKDLMKRDRYPGSAEVLGNKTTTLPEAPKPSYPNTAQGQWQKADDAARAKAGKEAAKDVAGAKEATRAAGAAALSRVLGPLLDVGIGALDLQSASGISYVRGVQIAKELEAKGILGSEEAYMLPRLMAAGEYDAARKMIEAGMAKRAEHQ